jgi:1-acyl-sn-glycerol-3-phosphate acyltransferase
MATPTKNRFKRLGQTAAFFGAFFIFAVAGSLVSVACFMPSLFFRGPRARLFGQRLIHGLFRLFGKYAFATGLAELDSGGMAALRGEKGLIVAANHPCLLDAVLMVYEMPHAVCLMKGSLAHNIIFSGTARLAGYIHNESRLGLVKKCRQRLQEGSNLLVFPEGTRTVGNQLWPFKMGFALAATLSGSPVQTVFIEADSDCLSKGRPLFKQPDFPLRYSLSLGRRFHPEPGEDAKDFGARVENYFRESLSRSAEKPTAAIQSK